MTVLFQKGFLAMIRLEFIKNQIWSVLNQEIRNKLVLPIIRVQVNDLKIGNRTEIQD